MLLTEGCAAGPAGLRLGPPGLSDEYVEWGATHITRAGDPSPANHPGRDDALSRRSRPRGLATWNAGSVGTGDGMRRPTRKPSECSGLLLADAGVVSARAGGGDLGGMLL